jgi:glyoxylase-like metal-dependent hydrolase (beta-lactamase superfamily II)
VLSWIIIRDSHEGDPMLESPIAGLRATPPAPLPFAPSISVRAFLLERVDGNLLVYNAPGLRSVADEIAALGGAMQHFINHAHEAMFGPSGLDVPVVVHDHDRVETEGSMPVAASFSSGYAIGDDFEVVPTPGHTPGTTSFLWRTGGQRLLFTGDMLWLDEGRWRAVVLGSSDRQRYVESLELLRDLPFDVLVPWGATAGRSFIDVVDPAEAQSRIDAIIERVRAGENA